MIFDTHCHLDFPAFDSDRAQVVQRCHELGVSRFLLPGVDIASWGRIERLCSAFPSFLPAYGLHPCFLAQHSATDLALLEDRLMTHRPLALGEIGLDFWAGREPARGQIALFQAQLKLAQSYSLPVLLHVRKAHDEVLQLLRQCRFAQGGIVHAFSGSLQQAEQYLELGFYMGVGGGVTYPRARKLRSTLSQLPLSTLVLETDSPDMPLAGYQGRRNSPEQLPKVLQALAELCTVDQLVLRAQLWRNSCAVLGVSP